MRIIQECEVCFKVYFPPEYRKDFDAWVHENLRCKSIKFENTFFNFYDMWIANGEYYFLGFAKVPCEYVEGWEGNPIEPPEPSYVEGWVDEDNFKYWLDDIIPSDYDVEIEIYKDKTHIPLEEDLIKLVEDF